MSNVPKNNKEAARIDFLGCVKTHKMEIELDQGVHRCIKFSRPESSVYYFRLTTWPGHLAISGDMGDYIFARTPDMFKFFRSDELEINYSYWTEKLKSVSKFGSSNEKTYEEYDAEATIEALKQDIVEGEITEEQQELFDYLESYSTSHEAMDKLYRHDVDVAYEYIRYRPTYHILWILYAIVWGIQQYDALKGKPDEQE